MVTQRVDERVEGQTEVEEGSFEIGNIDLLLDLISALDPDHVKALAQYILNSFDAFTPDVCPDRIQTGQIVVSFELNRPTPQIVISDNHARGMNREQLRSVPTKIGSSEKRKQWDELIDSVRTNKRLDLGGYQAIGVYVYRGLCEYLMIVTRSFKANSKTLAAILPTEHGAKWQIFEENQQREVPGTDIYLVGVKPQMWQKKDRERLKEYFRRAFRYRLMTANPPVELYVVEEPRKGAPPVKHRIMPAKFEGDKLPEDEIYTNWVDKSGNRHNDPTFLELYHHPGVTGGKIWVEFGQNFISDNLCLLEELNVVPFNSGELEGVVSPTFLLPDTPRGSFRRDEEGRFAAWVEKMRNFASELSRRIESSTREARTAEKREFERRMQVAFRNAAAQFDIDTAVRKSQDANGRDETAYSPPKGKRKKNRKSLDDYDQEIRDRWKTWIWSLLDQGITNPDKIRDLINKEHKVPLPGNIINAYIQAYHNRGKPKNTEENTDEDEQRKRRAELRAKFQLIYQHMWSGEGQVPVRSIWDATLIAVKINISHPEYVLLSKDESKSGLAAYNRYLVEVTVKALIPVYFEDEHDQTVLFERFVDLRNMIWKELGLAK